ncbi:MAG: iron hydrogenase small subunit [Anaerolineales bacterium]|nr:iron hydrogenase small subunit [Anaerolineales bacterium]
MWITINQQRIEFPTPATIYDVIHQAGETIANPPLGQLKECIRNPFCPQLGLAECDGQLVTLPALKRRMAKDGMTIETHSENVQQTLEARAKLLKEHHECTFITEWQRSVAIEAESTGFITLEAWENFSFPMRSSSPSIIHDPNKCVRCKACIEVCRDQQGVGALSFDEDKGIIIDDDLCVRCGQCIHHCPMGARGSSESILEFLGCDKCPFSDPIGAMHEVDDTENVRSLLNDKEMYCVAQFAPSIRASLGEEFNIPDGDLVTGKIYAALRKLGFKKVWDTNFAADLTIMEEGNELIQRIQTGGVLPQFTSCCPGWIRFAETFYPDLLLHISSAKSPQQMFAAIAKTFGAKSLGIDPVSMCVISIMPCTAKKYEQTRPEMAHANEYWEESQPQPNQSSYPDNDIVLTTRELARLLKMANIDLAEMPDEEADSMLGSYTGAAPIFGRTGGVMEAALRTAITILTGRPPKPLEFSTLESLEGIKKASLQLGNKTLKVAVAHGLYNVRTVCESVQSGGEFSEYHFIEFMCCPGGCIGGGGQPIPTNNATRAGRTKGLNTDDRQKSKIRMSHENPEIKALYSEFLKEPLSSLSHHLLHTTYVNRMKN